MNVRDYFDFDTLNLYCSMHEEEFFALGMTRVAVDQPKPMDYYYFKDNGASILAVAHLDTVVDHVDRFATIARTAGGDVVYSGALDDRLGAYVLGDLLPRMGLTFDLLLTVGEESGMSTAAFFDPSDHHDRDYNWIIEFDRGGTDVVMYQYEDRDLVEMVEATGARVAEGIFSDISYMEHLGIKAFNWGVGYRDYHGPRGHVWLDDLYKMVEHFLDFHSTWGDTHLPHVEREIPSFGWGGRRVISDAYVSVVDDETCEEAQYEEDACHGASLSTPYGVLCESHWEWYRD